MASVIFFRAVNVGLHQRFQPGELAKKLAAHDTVNIGAAGTMVIRKNTNAASLRAAILKQLPFQPEMMICPARDVLALVAADPFRKAPEGKEITRYVSVLAKKPKLAMKGPLSFPGAPWEVQLLEVMGPFVICVQRPGRKKLYPNAVVEKHFGVAATTRNWNTFVKIAAVLSE